MTLDTELRAHNCQEKVDKISGDVETTLIALPGGKKK